MSGAPFRLSFGTVLLVVVLAGVAAPSRAATPSVMQVGVASFYGGTFHGRQTANGEIFDKSRLTAAHRSLPFGTQLRVTNLRNGRSVIVRVNDRGPFRKGRIIDLSRAAAEALGFVERGLTQVRLTILPNLREDAVAESEAGL